MTSPITNITADSSITRNYDTDTISMVDMRKVDCFPNSNEIPTATKIPTISEKRRNDTIPLLSSSLCNNEKIPQLSKGRGTETTKLCTVTTYNGAIPTADNTENVYDRDKDSVINFNISYTDKNAMTEDVEMISTEVDNRGRTASLNSNNTVANMTNKTNNEETTSITSMEKTCAFKNNMPSEISLTTEIRTPSLGEESLISTSIKKTFDDVMVKKCDDEVQRTTRRKSTTVLGEVNEYHSNNWHDLSQFGNRSAAENDNSDEVDNENIAEDDTVQSMSEVRGDNTLKELVSEVKEDNTLKESMLFHETLGIEQRAELAGVISGTDSNSTGFSIIADTNLKDKESKPLTADQETIDATERMSTDYNISNAYSEAVLYAKQDKMEVNDVNDLKDNVLNIDNYDGKRQINCQELDGENQEIDGENQELYGENQEIDGENQELDGENQELDGENRELDGENRELDDENRELEDKNRDLYCENQELDSKSEDLIDKIQDMIDDLEYLENKDHNIADEEKLLEDDDDQESENHYQRNGGCKALNCKMDYYYQNVVSEDPEFDGDDQELIDTDQGSHENEISEQESGEEIKKLNSDNQESIDQRITSNDNLHTAAYDEEMNKDDDDHGGCEDDYKEEIDDEKSDFDVENRESVNVVHMNTASKTLHQDLETDIKTSQDDDPEFDGEDPDLNDNDLTFDENSSEFDGEDPKLNDNDFKFDGGDPAFDNIDFKIDSNSSDFDGEDPEFDGGESEFDDNDFKFDGNDSEFNGRDPDFEKLDSDTNRISNKNLDKIDLKLADNEISQHAVNTYDKNVLNEYDDDSSRNVDAVNLHEVIVYSEFDKANRIENISITMSSQKLTTEAESESLAEPSIVTNETECGSIAKSASQFTTETECGSISLSTSEFTTETECGSLGKSSVITNEIAHGTICPSLPELRDETEGESLAESSEVEPVAATESESLAESSVVTRTEYDDLSQSTQEFKIKIENEILAESSVVETEHVIIDQCLPCVTTETERIFQSLEKLSVKNESSSKSVEQTDLLERRETGTGGDETVVKLKERTCILDSKHGLKKIEFVETETRNKLKEYQIERQDTVAKIIPTELKTTKNCEPSEIKLVENNEIEPFDLNCTCVKELSERYIDTAVEIEKRESFELTNYKDNVLKDLDENIGYSRKRKLPSEFDRSFQNIGKKIHIDTGFVSDMVSGFFRIREIVTKQSEVDTKTLTRKLVEKMVRNFFERFTISDAPKDICCDISDNSEFLSILESVSMWMKKSLKYLVMNDLKALEINGLHNESVAGDSIINKSSTASTEKCNSLESTLINKLSQTDPAHSHSDFEMSQENLENEMKFRSDSPSEYELVIIGPHHLVNGFNDQKVYGTVNNRMFEKEEKSKKLDTEEILCENRPTTKSIMSSEVNLTKEVNMENVDRDQGLTQYTGESQDVHNYLDLTQYTGELQALITSTCTLVVDKNNTSSKSDVNKRAKKEFVFHCMPRDDDASSEKKCGCIPDCTSTKGKFKAETSTPPKHKLKLTKCEKIKVLKKKKKETSLPRKKIFQKELGENDNNPRKCKYKREDFSPRTKTSQREIGTNENMPCKSRSRKRRLDNSPKINDTPAKEGKKSKKKRKVGKCHSRIISDDIEIITDNESETELTNEKRTMVKSEKLNKSLERKKEPSVVALTDEMSVTHNSVNQKGNVRVVPSWN